MINRCPDCRENIKTAYHVCLDPAIAAKYIHELRNLNAIKNLEIETLEARVAELENELRRIDLNTSGYEGD